MPNQDQPPTPLKRRRTASLDCDDDRPLPLVSAPITRSDIWLEDGSIVLQAERTQFRVHKTLLSRHSGVFRDMFSIPQPPPSSEQDFIEGCPVVVLSDSAQDVGYLLSALYDQKYTSRDVLSFPLVAAMLRLGSKYDFQYLRNEALFRLRSEFPLTLQQWELLPSEYTHLQNQGGLLFDIINLALEQGILSILPVAYYLCVQDIEEIFNGQKRDDGSLATLPPNVQRACILGREKILLEQADATLSWLGPDEVSDQCFTPKECASQCAILVSDVWRPIPEPCRSLEKWAHVKKGRLCLACLEEASRIHQEGRQKMWDIMPMNFGFPSWEELRRMDR